MTAEPGGRPEPAASARLIFDDPLASPSRDDSDEGWGDRVPAAPGHGGAADLARFLDEKPPHHV
ncbi:MULTISPECIES: hypothetical protein [Streptomyces]|uniref:hypothetical protein n=1 Tax=Streptomyces TaxID=1883 RepID=UPI000CD57ADE|nr:MULTISPECIES: hypothetical protein [Streptomyces]